MTVLEACGNFHRLVRRSAQYSPDPRNRLSFLFLKVSDLYGPSKGMRVAISPYGREQSAAAGEAFWRKGSEHPTWRCEHDSTEVRQ
jgi:hypothetical protein